MRSLVVAHNAHGLPSGAGSAMAIPAVPAGSEAFSADPRRRAIRLRRTDRLRRPPAGPSGLVNDHLVGYFRYAELTGAGASGRGLRSGT